MNISKILKYRANEFMFDQAPGGLISSTIEATNEIDRCLNEIRNETDQYSFLVYIEKSLAEGLEKHEKTCTNPNCDADISFQDFQYNLNNRKKELFINSSEFEFSTEDRVILNQEIDNLNDRLTEVARTNGIALELIQELKEELESFRNDTIEFNKKQTERQYQGLLAKLIITLTKANLKSDQIAEVIGKDHNSISQVYESGQELLKLLI